MTNLVKLFELQTSTLSGAFAKIVSYLEREVSARLVQVPGVENYKNSKDHGSGIRFIFDGSTRCIRFNWSSPGAVGKADSIESIDVWDGRSRDPSTHITAKTGESFVQLLPKLALAIAPHATVTEAKKGEFTPETALTDFIFRLRKGKTFTRGDFAMLYHMENIDVFDTLVTKFANQITMTGKRVSAKRGTDWEKLKHDVLSASEGSLLVDDGGDNETFDEFNDESTGVSFADTLDNLASLVTVVAKGTANALFVAGKGGTGKTQTVEDALAKAGLRDGTGYYKVTGSATAAGIYTLLYKHHDAIILFDDSDGALDDVDARNLIKAATDTKKIRKLAWMKSGAITSKDGRLVPPAFNFEGRIIFISNLPLSKLDPDGAIRTRSFVIVVNPSNDEMVEHMKTILPNIKIEGNLNLKQRQKVLTVVKDVGKTQDINLRTLVRALNLCASGVSNWEQMVRLYA